MLFNLTILEPLIFIILLSIIKFYYDYFTRSIPYPGPLPLPIVGNLHHYFYHRNDIPSWLFQLTLKYGNVFELYFGSNKYLMISDSRIVERVMSSAKDNNYFVRVTTRKGLDELQKGHSGMLFNVDFDSWSYIRKFFIRTAAAPSALKFTVKLVNNVFQDLEKYWNTLIEEQGQFLHDDKEKSVEIDFATWAKRFFSEATMLMIANRPPNVLSTYYNRITNKNPDNNIQKNSNEEFLDRLFIASDCMQYYVMVPPLIRNLPIIKSYTNYLYENMMWTRNYAINLAKERREEIESMGDKEKLSSDMLTMLLTVNTPRDTTQDISNDNAKPMTLEEVGDNIVEILIEGADSPSNALSSILYCVGNNPDAEQRILDEIDKVFDHESDFNITYEDLSKLEYIEAVIKEALRIWPVTATISRLAANSDQIDEYKIPRSAQLAINVMGLHMNPNYWKEPMKFNPSRFLEDEKETYDKNAFLYFGGGLRLCPGKQLAMTQLKVMIVLLYKKYKFEMITKEPLMLYNISNQCKELKIRIKHRK